MTPQTDPDPVIQALALADPTLLRMALRFQRANPRHLLHALDLPCPRWRGLACRWLAGAGADPMAGDPCAVATAVARGWPTEAWGMQAAWIAWRWRMGLPPPGPFPGGAGAG